MEYPAGDIPRRRSFVERMIGAAMLDVSVYEEVEHDPTATGQAAGVVAIVAVCAAIGSMGHHHNAGFGLPLGAVLSALLGWVIMAGLTYVIGTRMFGGTADMGEMLRTLGFSRAPGVLAIIGFVPLLGWIALVAVSVWQLVTAVVAIRQALDFDTGKAVATALLAWLVVAAVTFGIMLMVGGTLLVGSLLAR
jgi:hypothetical protein